MFLSSIVFNIFVEELTSAIRKRIKRDVYRHLKGEYKIITVCTPKKYFVGKPRT